MGWKLEKGFHLVDRDMWVEYRGNDRLEKYQSMFFRPTESISDAWMVVEKLGTLDFVIQRQIERDYDSLTVTGELWWCKLRLFGDSAAATTAPLAICLAALKAVDVNIEEYTTSATNNQ